MGLQLSWLERTPDKREVDGSSPFKPIYPVTLSVTWGYSSVGRAPALQAGGQEFESPYLHWMIQEIVLSTLKTTHCMKKIERHLARKCKTKSILPILDIYFLKTRTKYSFKEPC